MDVWSAIWIIILISLGLVRYVIGAAVALLLVIWLAKLVAKKIKE